MSTKESAVHPIGSDVQYFSLERQKDIILPRVMGSYTCKDIKTILISLISTDRARQSWGLGSLITSHRLLKEMEADQWMSKRSVKPT